MERKRGSTALAAERKSAAVKTGGDAHRDEMSLQQGQTSTTLTEKRLSGGKKKANASP